MRRCFGVVTWLLACWLTPAGAAAPQAAVPVLIATQFGPDGKALPTPPLITTLVGLVATESGLPLVVRPYPWKRAQWLAARGEGLLFGASPTPERTARYRFSSPLYQVNHWLIVPAQRGFPFTTVEDLRGKVISIQNGAHYLGAFEAMRGKLFTVNENSENVASRLKMLALGRVDALLLDNFRSAAQFERRLNCVFAAAGTWAVLPRPVDAEPVLIAAAQGSAYERLLPALNAAIERLARDGAFERTLEQQGGNGC